MKRCLILCQNPALAASLRLWLMQEGHAEKELIAVKMVGQPPESAGIARTFEGLADWIESELEAGNSSGIPQFVALTDLCGYGNVTPDELNPVRPQGGWATVLGMLVLGFPEVHWVFASGTPVGEWSMNPTGSTAALREAHFAELPERLHGVLETVMHKVLSPLCDGTGLRDAIRAAMAVERGGFERLELPRRTNLAVAIDEERSYAWLHAYTAYRFGFRAQAVTTLAGMQWALRDTDLPPTLIFEDYFLQFGDGHPDGFSHLRVRDKSFGGEDERLGQLAGADNRILVTSGHHRGQSDEARIDNPVYLRELRSRGKWNRELNKPLGGIFNLWKDSGLQRKLRNGRRRGLAPEFYWPKKPEESESGHSTPGRLLVVADRLIARAERLLPVVQSVPHAVRGALLATDAMELLGNKTPTTSLEALALKHHFEVLAECQFVGMQQHMDVRARMKDIQREMEALSGWFGTKKRQRTAAVWNAELSILNKLIEVFRNHNQFDEEQMLQVRARELHRKLRFVNYPAFVKPLEIFPWYVEKLVASFPLFLVSIFFWVVFLGLAYAWASGMPLDRGLANAFSSFFSIEPPSDEALWKPPDGWNGPFWLVALTVGLGFVHLGILISHLYSIISRK
jgi:hypothetical protein